MINLKHASKNMTFGKYAIGVLVIFQLGGCAVPSRLTFDKELAELCAVPGRNVVIEEMSFTPNERTAQGGVKIKYTNGKGLLGESYWEENESIVLKSNPEHNLFLTKYETTYRKIATNKVVSHHVTYCRKGGDTFSLNNTSECCK